MNNVVTESAAGNLAASLLRSLVDELRTLQQPWHQTSEATQTQVIDRLRFSVMQSCSLAVREIAGGGFKAFPGTLQQLTIKDGIKAVMNLSSVTANLDALVADVGAPVLLVIAKPQDYTAGIEAIVADPDQPELPIEPPGDTDVPPVEAAPGASEPADDDDGDEADASEGEPEPLEPL